MPYPEYIPTRVVSIGGAAGLESGALLKIQVALVASRSLIWDATGYRFEKVGFAVESELGNEVQVVLPRTDVAGWKDAATGSLIDVSAPEAYSHRYTATVRFVDADGKVISGRQYEIGPFVLPAGDGAIDLDKMVPASTVAGDAISVPDLWTQLVADAQVAAAAAQAALIDSESFVGDQVATPGKPAHDSLLGTIAEVVEASVPAEPINAWYVIGDSMSADGTTSGNWSDKFVAANSFSATLYNGAQPGETAAQQLNRVTTQGQSYLDRHFTIAVGRNGVPTLAPWVIVDQIRQMLVQFSRKPEGFVFDVAPSTSDSTADAARVVELNKEIAFAFPDLFVPIFALLRTAEAAQAAEIVFTSGDEADIAAGNTPGSFRTDHVHLNDAGGKAVAYFLQKHAYLRGYVTAAPVLPPALGPNLLANGTFETDLTGWEGTNSSITTRTTAEHHSGVAALSQFFSSNTVAMARQTDFGVAVAPNKAITARAWVKGPAGVALLMRVFTVTSADVALQNIDSSTLTLTGDWQEIIATGTTGATAAKARIELRKGAASASATPTVFMDDVRMYQPA